MLKQDQVFVKIVRITCGFGQDKKTSVAQIFLVKNLF